VNVGWNTRELCERTTRSDDFAKRVAAGRASVGLALAHSGLAAVDIDNIEKARSWFADHGIDFDALINAPDAVRRESGRPNRTLLLYKVSAPLRTRKVPDAGIEFLCATSQGLTTQIAIPPSVNPKSRRRYEWKGDWRQPPELPDDLRRVWESVGAADVDPERKATPPHEKGGAVGAICRAYDPREEFPHSALPAPVFEAMCENVGPGGGDRHAYLKAASGRMDGLLVLPDGAIQIFDATFPGDGVGSMNIFDFMRLSLFASEDSAEDLQRPVYERPSYKKLLEALLNEPRVRQHRQTADAGFEDLDAKEGSQSGAEAPRTEAPKTKGRGPLIFHKIPRDILTLQFPEQRFALYPWFPCGTTSLIAAMGGYGKGYVLLYMTLCKALGLDFCGQSCTPGRVVIVSGEDDLDEMRRRVQKVLKWLVESRGASIDWNLLEVNFGMVDRVGCGAENMMVQAKDKGFVSTDLSAFLAQQIGSAEWIVLDTKGRFSGGADENDNGAGSAFINACEVLAARTGAAVTISAHTGKAVAREGIVDQYAIRGASSLADDARSVMVLASPTDAQLKLYEFDPEALGKQDVFRMVHTKHNRSKKSDEIFFQRRDNGVVTPITPKMRYIMSSEERVWQLIRRIGVSEISRRRIKDEYRSIFGAACTRECAYEIFDAAIRDGLLTVARSHGQTDCYRASDKALKELATRRPPGESMDDIAAQPPAAAPSQPMPEPTAATAAEAPKERKARKKPAEPDVPVDPVERAAAVETARQWFDDIQSEAAEQPAAADQSASKTVTPDVVLTPTPAALAATPAPTPQSVPPASDGAADASQAAALVDQIRALPDHAAKLVKGGIKTPEQVAKASDAAMRACEIHPVYAKTLKNAANRWLAAQPRPRVGDERV
jgi:hypothetical protein